MIGIARDLPLALRTAAAICALVLAAGCASVRPAAGGGTASTTTGTTTTGTTAAAAPAVAPNPDPWENFNRKIFSFNETIDRVVLKPVAETYRKVVPQLVRTGIDNVLGNIYDVWSTANQFLQGKLQYGMEMGMRVLTNTTVGLGGILDPATEFGLVRRSEDFGQTLGRWGVGNGPFLVLPLLGPSTVRDTVGVVVDRGVGLSPSSLPQTSAGTYGVVGVEVVNTRTKLLDAGSLVDDVALDKYTFFRDGYLSRRRDAVYDGAPPMDSFDTDPGDDAAPPAGAAASAPGTGGVTAPRPGAVAVPPARPGAAPASRAPGTPGAAGGARPAAAPAASGPSTGSSPRSSTTTPR